MADWGFLDQERGLSVPLLHFDDLFLQSVEGKLAPDDLKDKVRIATVEQDDTRRVIAGFLLAQGNIPTQNYPVRRPRFDYGIILQHFALDDLAAGGLGR